jgi:putative aminopeptidase FrvX
MIPRWSRYHLKLSSSAEGFCNDRGVKCIFDFFHAYHEKSQNEKFPQKMDISRAAALVSVPNRYMHTSVEVVALADLEAAVALIAETIASMSGRENFIPG